MNPEHKGGQKVVHDACIVCTAVGKQTFTYEVKLNSEEIKP